MAADKIAHYRVTDGREFRLKDCHPGPTNGLPSKERSAEALESGLARLSGLQEKLYADDRWAMLLIFQAMDAAGKDSTIKHVMSGVDPLGCQVYSFKAPSAEELDHDVAPLASGMLSTPRARCRWAKASAQRKTDTNIPARGSLKPVGSVPSSRWLDRTFLPRSGYPHPQPPVLLEKSSIL
jgi:hypothetical protein